MSVPQDVDVLERLIDTVGVGVGMYGSDGEFLYVNDAYADMLGTEPSSLVGTPLWTVNPEFDPDLFEAYWDSFEEGETRFAEATHEFDGTRVQVATVTTRTTVDGTAYHVGTIRDISPLKQREAQLEQLHRVTRNLMEADSREEIADITARTAETILGYESSVVRFRVGDELQPVAVTDQAKEHMGPRPSYPLDSDTPVARTYRAGEPEVFDDVRVLDDGYDRGIARTVMYLPVGDYGVLSVASSVAGAFDQADVYLASILAANTQTALERLANERSLERKNDRLEAFYDVISHDIPNHLNVAETRLELALRQDDMDHLDSVSTAHSRIQEVIEDMRTLVKQGETVEDREWVPLAETARVCWDRCRPEDGTASLTVAEDGHVEAAPSRFKQLLENLFWNAIEHAGGDATVRVGLLDDGFYVEDDGPGIPPEDRETVLTPGYTTADRHSGFGLAIVKEIVRAHDWSLAVTDGHDGGARFEITGANVQ